MALYLEICYNGLMIILQANKIERSFAGELLFDNINLQVDESDRIALVGKNGAGKSTLLKILVGEEEPTSGQINKKRDLSLSYLAQDSRFESENTIYDEMLLVFDSLRQQEKRLRQMELQMGELSGEDLTALMNQYDQLSEDFRQKGGFTYEADIRAILNGFKFDQSMWQMKISELSGGQNTRLALAKMLLEKPELLVLDEPTNHLDIETIAWLETYYFLDKVATITLDLTKHSLDRYVGNYSSFVVQKEQKLATEAKNYEKQQKEIAALEDFVNRNLVRASTTKRAQSRRKQLEKMERLDRPETGSRSANMTFKSDKVSGNVVLTLEDAAIGYGEEVLSEPINLDIRKFNAVAIVGPNGIGKTTLIKSLIGQVPFIRGKEQLGANVEVGYYDQTQSKLTASNTVLDELWNDFKLTPEVEIRNRLGAFLFSGDDVKKSVGMLSGGERARLLLAKLSMENNNFLILDEPTNHHDRYFINRVATQIIELSETGSTLYLGDYDYYLEKKAEQEALREETEQTSPDKPAPANDYQLQKENQKEQRRLARRLEQLEAQIEDLDSQISQLQEAMQTTNDAGELMESQQQIDQLTAAQEEAMLEWEELAEKV